MQPGKAKSVGTLIDAAVRGELSRAHALQLCKDNPEVITLALLAAGQRIAEQDILIARLQTQAKGTVASPSTPSGMVPNLHQTERTQAAQEARRQEGPSGPPA